MKKIFIFILFFSSIACYSQRGTIPANKLPNELKKFVEKGSEALAFEAADLNGDKLQDYVLILEKKAMNSDQSPIEEGQRPLLIILRKADNSLWLAKRNDKIVFCSACGGVWGDPFESLTAGPKTFTVKHYGGSNERWTNSFKFNYSRIDNTWQLVKVEESTFHTSKPAKPKVTIYTPPKGFGKIDIKDFDPDNFKNQGAK